jgi:hypothetical protein
MSQHLLKTNKTSRHRAASNRFFMRSLARFGITILAIGTGLVIAPSRSLASASDDEKSVAAPDTQYQAAVEKMMRLRWIES